jgi:NAD(P)-dependent dehydrogenase (short-subunit alcohol dehydrogenase family)
MSIQFTGRVALVTGAGGGLGRSHALELAKRGAKVVVNDLGGAVDGTGGSSAAAQAVVAEIKAAGGEAIADGASVTDDAGVERLVKRTLDAFGRIDIVVNNAGVLRDKTFSKMEVGDFQFVVDVHLMGTVKVTRACWPYLKQQQYGRIMVTTSPTGLFGNFGQANYGAAKAGLLGFMLTLKIEGAKDNIRANALSPIAMTRMTESLFPPEQLAYFKPEYVTAGALCLLDEEAPSGAILVAGGGYFTLVEHLEGEGMALPREGLTPEAVRANWAAISDMSKVRSVSDANSVVGIVAEHIAKLG